MMKKHFLLTTLMLVMLGLGACAQNPAPASTNDKATHQGMMKAAPNGSASYYKNADGLSGAELKTALFNIIKNHTTIPYSGLGEKYKQTDKRADGKLRDWYDNTTNYDWNTSGWNKEHLVPQSWFSESSPMKSDIVHVVFTNSSSNSDRGSYPLAEVGKKSNKCKTTYCIYGECKTPGYTGTVYEPNDEIKGDIARIYFYMATCYEDKIASWTNGSGNTVIGGNAYKPYKEWYMDMLMRWSKQDPVDEVEIARNNAIASKDVQNNRNPFVDYPGLEDYIWGDKVDQPFSYDNYDSSVAYVARPTFESQKNDDGTMTITINCTAEDATIYFTLDGSDPTTDSEQYTAPFDISETTTVKAIAVTEEAQSAVAEQTFTIKQGGDTPPAGDGSYVRVNSTDEMVSGANYLLVYEISSTEGRAMSSAEDKAENSEEVQIVDETIDKGGIPFVLTQLGNGNWTICSGGDTYLAHASASNSITTATSGDDASAQWSISIGADADIINQKTSYAIRFNKASNQLRFRCYKQGGQEPVALYIQTQGEVDAVKGVTNRQYEKPNTQIFTIDGRKISTTATVPRGVYIINGKKVVK